MTAEDFTAYFFNSTTVVGIVSDGSKATLEEAVAGRDIEEALGGAVYMYVRGLAPLLHGADSSKPNYPGRSSHVSPGSSPSERWKRRRAECRTVTAVSSSPKSNDAARLVKR